MSYSSLPPVTLATNCRGTTRAPSSNPGSGATASAPTSNSGSGDTAGSATNQSTGADGIVSSSTAPIGLGSLNLGWGVDVHNPSWGGAYSANSAEQEVESAKSLGASYVYTNLEAGDPSYTQQIIQAAQADNMSIVAQVATDSGEAQQVAQQVLADGGSNTVKVVQFGNEQDLDPSSQWSSDISQFQAAENGWNSVLPNTPVAIGLTNQATGDQFLTQMQQSGVNWDVTAFHTYAPDNATDTLTASFNQSTPEEEYQQFGKPILINEFNSQTPGSAASPTTIGNLMASISQDAQQSDIIGASIYDMYSDSTGSYGIIDPTTQALNPDGVAFASADQVNNFV